MAWFAESMNNSNIPHLKCKRFLTFSTDFISGNKMFWKEIFDGDTTGQ
jgi:hypothetical protein